LLPMTLRERRVPLCAGPAKMRLFRYGIIFAAPL
jgi:hypothetical protein